MKYSFEVRGTSDGYAVVKSTVLYTVTEVANYRSEEVAQVVATFLNELRDQEVGYDSLVHE